MRKVNDVISLLQESVQKYTHKPFLIAEDRIYSFLEIEQLSSKLSDGLHHLGVKQGDHLAFFLEGGVEIVVMRLAAQKLGALIIPINNRLIGPEIEYLIRDSEANWVVVQSNFLANFHDVNIPDLSGRMIVVGEVPPGIEAVSYQDLLAKGGTATPVANIDPEDPAMILYTSGTTGRPKGAVIRHCNSIASGQWLSSVVRMRPGDILLSSTPMYNASSLNGYFVASLMMGVPWVLTKRFSPKDVLSKIEQFRVTIYHAAGPMTIMVMNHETFSQRNLSSLRLITWSNNLPLASMEQFRKVLPNTDIIQFYGFTESSPVGTHIHLKDMLKRPGSCGNLDPAYGSFRVVDEQGRDLSPGETGEIIHQSKGLMREYYNNKEANQESMKNGWFSTGDLGKFDEDGYLYIVGRIKEMISRGGEKVYAPEVEQVLCWHPAVTEAAVVGMPHEILGEEVRAYVVLKKGAQVTEEELIAYCDGKIAHFKTPKTIEFRTEFPRNSMGKILKYEMVYSK